MPDLTAVRKRTRPDTSKLSGEPLAIHEAAIFQNAVGQQEAIGADEIDLRTGRHASKQLAENTCRGALAYGNTSGEANDIGNPGVRVSEEVRRGVEEVLTGDEI